MMATMRESSLPLLWSVLLHGGLVVGMLLAANLSLQRPTQVALGPSIDAVAIDSNVLKIMQDRKQAQTDVRKVAAAAEIRQHAATSAKAAAQAEQEAQRQSVAQAAATRAASLAATQAATLAATQKADAAAAKMAAAKLAAADEQRLAEAAKAAAAAEQKLRTQRETELRRQLADEEQMSALQSGPMQKSYIASIQNRITRAWLKPVSARSGIVCRIEVTQIAGGEVTKARVTDCNGDESVRQSIENAVYRASPLPEPPDPSLFQRNLTLVFKPNE